jgi:hypothetical protein
VTDKMMELIREFAEIKLDGKDEWLWVDGMPRLGALKVVIV